MSKRKQDQTTAGDTKRIKQPKHVSFAPHEQLETIHHGERYKNAEDGQEGDDNDPVSTSVHLMEEIADPVSTSVRLTEDITVLSAAHGRARRQLREISKIDLQAAIKYGVKTQANRDPKTKLPRWMYIFGNIICITDHTSKQEVTCYTEPITIQRAPISKEMTERHTEVKQILLDEPELCSSHTIVILDQSGSMRKSDVAGFRNRSQAAYGCLALDYVAEQLYQQGDHRGIDALTLIEMNDDGTMLYEREPLDWILFNKLLHRQTCARPRSHGNYVGSLRLAQQHIEKEKARLGDIGLRGFPLFALVFLSDGKPSDNDELSVRAQQHIVGELSELLKDKLTVFCIGLGASDADFAALNGLVATAVQKGAQAEFSHAGLAAASLGGGFSSISSTMSSLRDGLLSSAGDDHEKQDARKIVLLKNRESLAKSTDSCRTISSGVYRYKFKQDQWDLRQEPWLQVPLLNKSAVGFQMDKIPFGMGRERFGFRFQEVNSRGDLIGKVMVAKESRCVEDAKRVEFHAHFCRAQQKAGDLATLFNKAVMKTPELRPIHDFDRTPVIAFVKCHIYVVKDCTGRQEGRLVENLLKGKFTKYNGNNGYVNSQRHLDRTVVLNGGVVLLTEFLHAFSHWSYVHTNRKLLVSDLQGVLNEEGTCPKFELTDPAICSQHSGRNRFGRTDGGSWGVRQFFRSHKCSLVCKCLGLPPVGTRRR